MFSSRTRWERAPNRLTALVVEKRMRGEPILDLTVSNPTAVGLLAPSDLFAPLSEPGGAAYEPEPRGLLPARQAVAADFGRRGQAVDPDRILLCASTSEAYAWLFKLLADPGDHILAPRPSYPLFGYLAGLEAAEVRSYPLRYDGVWHIDLPALERAITPRTRALVAVHPNNPTGSFITRAEERRLVEICARNGCALIVDEVFVDFPFSGTTTGVARFEDAGKALVFRLGGLSKSCGLPQLKLAWMAVEGPAAACAEALARLEIVADTYLSAGTPVQRAAARILARLPELQAPIRRRVARNLDLLKKQSAGSAATLLAADGGWSAVLQVPATHSEEARVCRLLEKDAVLIHPGFFFDFEREAHLVLSLLPREEEFARGVELVLADAAC